MSEYYGPADDAQSMATLRHAFDLGITFFDTADIYGRGANERLVGTFLRDVRRSEVVVATKIGCVRDPKPAITSTMRGDAAYVRQACDASLERLGVDQIDLLYLHGPDPRVPIEDTVGAMAGLVTAGKVRYLGLSNVTAEQVLASHAVHPIAAVQSEWSLFSRGEEQGVIAACAALGIGFVPYSPLCRGFLTGVHVSTEKLARDDFRQVMPRFIGRNARHNAGLLDPLRRIADAHGGTPAQVALAWLHRQADVRGLPVVPIPGTRRVDRLVENADAVDLMLSLADLAVLEPLAAHVAGARHPVI